MCTDTEILDGHTTLWKRRTFLLDTLSMLALMFSIIVAIPVPADRGMGFYATFLVLPIFFGATAYSWRRWRAAKNDLKKHGAIKHRLNVEQDGTR